MANDDARRSLASSMALLGRVNFQELAKMEDREFAVCANYFRQLKAKFPVGAENDAAERMPITKSYGSRSRKFLHLLRYDAPTGADGKQLTCGLTILRFQTFIDFIEQAMYLDVPEAKNEKEEKAIEEQMKERVERLNREFRGKSSSYESAAQIRRVTGRVVWGQRQTLRDFLSLVSDNDASVRALANSLGCTLCKARVISLISRSTRSDPQRHTPLRRMCSSFFVDPRYVCFARCVPRSRHQARCAAREIRFCTRCWSCRYCRGWCVHRHREPCLAYWAFPIRYEAARQSQGHQCNQQGLMPSILLMSIYLFLSPVLLVKQAQSY